MGYKSRRKIKRSRGKSKKSRKLRFRSKKLKGGSNEFERVFYKDLDLNGKTVYYDQDYVKIGTYVSDGDPQAVTFKDEAGNTITKNMRMDQIYKMK